MTLYLAHTGPSPCLIVLSLPRRGVPSAGGGYVLYVSARTTRAGLTRVRMSETGLVEG